MPMYFPDLESVRQLAISMLRHKGDKKYQGIIPKDENELPRARIQLAEYLRSVWKDDIFAVEVEYGTTSENYDSVMKMYAGKKMLEMLK